MNDSAVHDIFVIGGGINGCGIARDAAGRGYSVVLAEMKDLAAGTSSASTKLIHGGLRYLEHYEFRLVREALMEREVLWTMAPHVIWPMRFVLPFHKGGPRPAWLIRLGLFLYDHIGGRKLLPPTRTLDLTRDPAGGPLKPLFGKAFEYSDGWVDDARLVVLNARDASRRGADIRIGARVTSARRENGHWTIETRQGDAAPKSTVRARMLVNAAGPWVDSILVDVLGLNDTHNVRLVQGSHIVVRQKFADPRAYFFQNPDGRIIFAIPYQEEFTLIGTTDSDYRGDPGEVAISDEEIDYLCRSASDYFAAPVTREDIVWCYSGVRPLYDDGASKAQEATRDYVLKMEADGGKAPLLNVFGGKLTTYRRLAEHALEHIGEAIGPKGGSWTAGSHLPGGNFPVEGFDALVRALAERYPFLAPPHVRRMARLYGTDATAILADAKNPADLGRYFGGDLYEVEIRWLMREEWARHAEDVLWRRTKQGLHLSKEEARTLEDFMITVPRH
ncbi:glycerol-3-phosphate dehydrogenase [Shinella daejeonensis]|uniref:glycerol-3-phosphate dehydrogenase n=1 Tax=Shinella daejeonensis TaxID=659017 RepID=UPI0020C7E906|nr:glycerol-3-phosphate dehydrogenase [Shinella daejeonensis]MCP8896136.1 glycerol-3-phosphate dehydrogenase [Shinella daejeonensis]